jgi:hypothetical protein
MKIVYQAFLIIDWREFRLKTFYHGILFQQSN